MHYMNAEKTYREKAKWELYKNAENCIEQILETHHKTAAVQQVTFHF